MVLGRRVGPCWGIGCLYELVAVLCALGPYMGLRKPRTVTGTSRAPERLWELWHVCVFSFGQTCAVPLGAVRRVSACLPAVAVFVSRSSLAAAVLREEPVGG